MTKPIILILIGNIGTGKTTIAKKYVKQGCVAIARDRLRYAIGDGDYIFDENYEPVIWATEKYMLNKFMDIGVNIIVDEVGISKEMRKVYLEKAEIFGYNAVALVMPKLSMKEAVDRRMNDPHGQPDKKLWEQVWSKFNSQYEEPTKEEGFKEIIYINGKK